MPEALKVNKGAEACLRDFLKFLLEKERVKGVFCLRETGGGAAYSLITDPAALDEAVPLFPLLPASAAKVLANLTLVEPAAEPIAVVIKPCELRALTELMKRNQGSLENLLLISFTCAGAYPLEMSVNGDIEAKLPAYWEAVKKAEIPADIRPACAACEHFVPYNADITLELVGNKDADKKCLMHLNNEKAEQFAQGFEGESGGGEIDAAVIDSLKAKRQEKKQALFTELGIEAIDTDKDFGIRKIFEKCIGCRNCSKVCPACYCRICFFETGGDEHEPNYYETEMARNGYGQVLPAPVFYQLVRLFHASLSCVGCGLCADVCPVDIPLWAVAMKTSGAVQESFGYTAGRDLEEELPITAFKPDEFAAMVD